MSVRFTRILVGLDPVNTSSESIASVAFSMAKLHGSDLRVVGAVPSSQPSFVASPDMMPVGSTAAATLQSRQEVYQRGQEFMNRVTNIGSRDDRVSSIVRMGALANILIEEANAWAADLIIIGGEERSLFEKIVFASASETIVRASQTAVLVLPKNVTFGS